jgi:uncharacterized delta-60 repeat protein
MSDTFSPMVGGSYPQVRALAVQADGSVLLGGWFSGVGALPRMNIARLNADGTLDTQFDPGANEMVNAVAELPNGKILVAGAFTQLGGQGRNRLARLNADGTLDDGFFGNVSGSSYASVFSVALQTDGKLVVGGAFSTLGGQTHNNLGRIEADGTVDTAFAADVEGGVYSLVIQPDGKILVGGYFQMLASDGSWRTNLVRINPDGTLDSGFAPNANSPVWSLALQADNRIVVGGSFTVLGGQPRSGLARLNSDGSVDSGFNPGVAGSPPYVYSLVMQTDGKILLGGFFTAVAGPSGAYLARLNSDGSLDSGFNPIANGIVDALAIQGDGKVLVGGEFSYLGGGARYCLGRLNATELATQNLNVDGTTISWLRGGTSPEVSRASFDCSSDSVTWTALGEGSRVAGGWQLNGVAVPIGGTLRARGWVCGGYGNASGWLVEGYSGAPIFLSQPVSQDQDAGDLARFIIAAGGSGPLSFQWLKNGAPLAEGGNVAGVETGTLTLTNVLGGDAGLYSVVVSNNSGSVTSALAILTVRDPVILNQPESQSRELGQGASFSIIAKGTTPLIYQWWKDGVALTGATRTSLTLTNLQAGDAGIYRVVVSNQWDTVSSSEALLTVNLITLDTNFDLSLNGSVYALIQQSDGKLVIAGDFTMIEGQPRNRIARLNSDGTLDASFNPGAGGPVDALALQPDGKILLGGTYFTVGGQPRTNLARLNPNGSLDLAFNPGSDYAGYVYSLAVQPDGKILIGGEFTNMAGKPRNRIARLNSDGALDDTFGASAGAGVLALAVLPGGKILLGGCFRELNGQSRNCLARVNADGSLDYGFDPAPDGCVTAIALQADGEILVGGAFSRMGGQAHTNLARLLPNGTLDSDFHPQAGTIYENDYPSVYSLAVQMDEKILVGGSFSTFNGEGRFYLARLYRDGTLDRGFSPSMSSAVNSLALRSDGRLLIAGSVVTPDAQWHSGLLRFNNSGPANQEIIADNSDLTWLRGGTGPEVWRTTFEHSSDGLSWTQLGEGTRVFGGWQLSGLSMPAGGTLRARGYLTGAQYNGSCWFIEASTGNPIFLDPPLSATNNAGTTATFNVSVGGSEPFSFQWLKDGVPLADSGNAHGVATATLQISNVLKADEGFYSLVVSNTFAGATSAVVRLTVIDPVITTQPLNQMGQLGENAIFNIGAAGTAPLRFQWWKEDAPLSGATAASLTLTNLEAGDVGSYRAVVSNQYGSATSAVASLTVNLASLDAASVPSADRDVYALALQPDGKILVGGAFTRLGAQSRANLARLNPDGSLDSAFNPMPNYEVHALALQPDGKILVGGRFTSVAGQPRNSLARLNSNGTLDFSFKAETGSSSSVYALAIQTDGKILVGGAFTRFNGLVRTNLARVSADGSLDGSFNPAPRSGGLFPRLGLSEVQCLAVQPDGKILLGGSFTLLAGQPRSNLGRLNSDGSIDSGFSPSASSSVLSLVLQADGRILLGGSFTRLAGQSCTNLARVNLNGSLDTSFTPGGLAAAPSLFRDSSVTTLAVQTDGTILAGGAFTLMGGQPRTNLVLLNADGTLCIGLNPGPGGSISSTLSSIAVQPDGKILIGGSFTSVSGQSHSNLARLNRPAAATQTLSYNPSTITWLRSGTGPEVERVTFEASTNVAAWLPLGGGHRVLGGWELTNVTVAAGATIRARGFVATSGIGESIIESILHEVPVIVINDGAFGVISNQFGFNVGGLAGWTIVVERSTDLQHWSPVQTNLMESTRVHFSDPDSMQAPHCFYRARLWP